MLSRFKETQIKLGIPTKELSDICNVSQQMVYYWREYGVRNWRTAWKLADKLGCKPEELIGFK